MNIKKKLITFIMALVIIAGFMPVQRVQADTTADFKIVSSTKVTASQAKAWAKSKGATDTFASLADLFWKYSATCGNVNPAIAYVQAAKETGYGKFGGVIDETYMNTCGLKTSTGGGDYEKEAHQRFKSWDEGVQAHLDHLALYAGATGYPKTNTYDPRHFASIKGKASTVNALGGNWAPSATYGEEIGKLYMNLMDYAGVSYEGSGESGSNSGNTSTSSEPNPGPIETKPNGLNAESVLVGGIEAEKITVDTTIKTTSTIGWKKQGGVWYYYKSNNTKATGWIKPDNNWYYLDTRTGAMKTGWVKSGSVWYYFKSSGTMVKGWNLIGGKWYFFDNDGAMLTGIVNDGKYLYYLEGSGAMTTKKGWISYNNKWYYSYGSGIVRTGWNLIGGTWYFMQSDGTMVTGYKKINTKTYSFKDSGAMETGWKSVNNVWYYFYANGDMATGWIKPGRTWYYMYNNGAMAKGWQKIGSDWYYFNTDGSMKTGWFLSNGDYYYLYPTNGNMATSTTIDGYKIGSNGIMGSNSTSSTGSKVIVVDAGHDYGKDFGAVSTLSGITYSETDLNMLVADKLEKSLKAKGYTVIMTRKLGEKPSYTSLSASLSARVNLANSKDADLFISVHHNSATAAAKGIETYYSSTAQDSAFATGSIASNKLSVSKSLATAINNSMVNAVGAVNRGAKDSGLYVCRNTDMPSVLIEVGFISNEEEAKRCANTASQQKIADAIANAVSANFK